MRFLAPVTELCAVGSGVLIFSLNSSYMVLPWRRSSCRAPSSSPSTRRTSGARLAPPPAPAPRPAPTPAPHPLTAPSSPIAGGRVPCSPTMSAPEPPPTRARSPLALPHRVGGGRGAERQPPERPGDRIRIVHRRRESADGGQILCDVSVRHLLQVVPGAAGGADRGAADPPGDGLPLPPPPPPPHHHHLHPTLTPSPTPTSPLLLLLQHFAYNNLSALFIVVVLGYPSLLLLAFAMLIWRESYWKITRVVAALLAASLCALLALVIVIFVYISRQAGSSSSSPAPSSRRPSR